MIVATLFFLFSDHPVFQEFEEWDEFQVIEETYETFIGESLIGSEEWTEYLKEEDPQIEPEIIGEEWEILYKRYVKEGTTAIDYGAGYGGRALSFARHVGVDGKVFALEREPTLFRALFWNLVHGTVQNAKIFCPAEDERLDDWELENVSLIRIDADGREDLILKGAEKTIRKCKPVLILNMLGGILIERSDRYTKVEFDRRISEIQKMGYTMQRITGSWYLGLESKKGV